MTKTSGAIAVDVYADTVTCANFPLDQNRIVGSSIPRSGAGIIDNVFSCVQNLENGITVTTILLDLEGATCNTTANSVIGVIGSDPAFLILLQNHGQIYQASLACLETPNAGVGDINLAFSSSELSYGETTGITTMIDAGGAWAINGYKEMANAVSVEDRPSVGDYIYLTNGSSGTTATYTTGQFILTLYGCRADGGGI